MGGGDPSRSLSIQQLQLQNMVRILVLLSVIVVLLVRNTGTASIEIPKNGTYILYTTRPSTYIIEDKYSTRILESNQTKISNYGNEGTVVSETSEHDPSLNVSNFITPSPPENKTCFRRDFNGDVAAVFYEKVGPISTAFLVFNTTYSSFNMGIIHNTTELTELKMINETTVECSEYEYTKYIQYALNIFTKHSLVG